MDTITQRLIDDFEVVRLSGKANMISSKEVQYIANELNCYALVCWIEDNRKYYPELLKTIKGN
jgi:hypothetical protein